MKQTVYLALRKHDSPRQFGGEAVLWVHASKQAGRWYQGILEADERFMARWHVKEEKRSSESRAARMRDAQSRRGVGGSRETAGEASKKETAGRVARYY